MHPPGVFVPRYAEEQPEDPRGARALGHQDAVHGRRVHLRGEDKEPLERAHARQARREACYWQAIGPAERISSEEVLLRAGRGRCALAVI